MAWLNTVVDVHRAEWPGGLPWGSVDYPHPDTTFYGDEIDIFGWALAPGGPADGIEVDVDGERAARLAPNRLRPEVASTYPDIPRAEESGFFGTFAGSSREEYSAEAYGVSGDVRFALGTLRLERRWRDPPVGDPSVAVVIPCHNQGHFLADSIGSAQAQTYPNVEVVVVDDGSADGSADTARRLGARALRQEQQGPAAARNAGYAATSSDFVVFLDADNVLMPHAVEANLHCFEDHPECALVSGGHLRIDHEGQLLPYSVPAGSAPANHYAALLEGNYIGSADNVMFRRAALDDVGPFGSGIDGAEDHDLYMRIAARYPIHTHSLTVSRFREHDAQFSRNHAVMLRTELEVLGRQADRAARDPELKAAHRRGVDTVRSLYGDPLAAELRTALRERRWRDAAKAGKPLLRWHRRGLLRALSPVQPPA